MSAKKKSRVIHVKESVTAITGLPNIPDRGKCFAVVSKSEKRFRQEVIQKFSPQPENRTSKLDLVIS